MNRITRRTEEGRAALKAGNGVWKAVNRLAEYEDTGLDPEDILYLQEKEKFYEDREESMLDSWSDNW